MYLVVVHTHNVREGVNGNSPGSGSFGLFLRGVYGLAAEHLKHFAEYKAETLAARVNHARLFQLRQQLGGVGKSLLSLLADLVPYYHRVVGSPAKVAGFFGSLTRNGEYGALGGLHYRLVSALHAEL